jgi:hypothetical protein
MLETLGFGSLCPYINGIEVFGSFFKMVPKVLGCSRDIGHWVFMFLYKCN